MNTRGQLLGEGDEDDELLADVARRYYLDNTSKVDIAKDLNLSRFKIARLLEDARARGIVQIQIKSPSPIDRALADELASALGVPRCVVTHTSGSPEQVRDQVAEAAARTVAPLVHDGDLLGLTWSRAVDAMVDHFDALPACTVIQMAGSLHSPAGGGSTMDLARRAAALAGGTAHAVHAPLVVDDIAAVAALRRQPGIADTLALADGLDISVVAIGAWRAGCSTVWDAVSEELRDEGLAGGAIAEISGHLLDQDGRLVESPLEQMIIAVSIDQLRRPAERVALAAGAHRAPAVIAAVRAGLVSTLVTTTDLAREVLRQLAALERT
ncbi:sugar-binding domain-containing protein [Kribbella sp. NPDC006257]|uniref:sugar-binding transcriptional regulator n=1 Tax=Kribbella sp. NPDC006257 TaxID=3156738 RepID=UPI0033B703CE